jgi:nucleotide-binding universal stress UspA family protein
MTVTGGATMKIVVGVDGSPASDEALRWAMTEARQWDATVVAVHAWDVPYTAYATPVAVDERCIEGAARQVLTEALARTVVAPAFALDERLVRGAPENVLAAAAADADMLVVGSTHHGALGRLLLGSVSRAVSDRVACPVVVVHASVPVAA